MVIAWHFTHGHGGSPVPFDYVPSIFPFALLDEGHTGVALFMTLSGYLFAKLLDGKSIDYRAFIWNRALRLLPLLAVVIAIAGAGNLLVGRLGAYLLTIPEGLVLPTLPNGGWSITVEFHFYLVLPLFLWMLSKSRSLPFSILAASILSRVIVLHVRGDVSDIAYGTIVGRIDQFALGMLAFQFRSVIARRHLVAFLVLSAFALFYWYFDRHGGLTDSANDGDIRTLWVVFPTVEGLAYAVGIAWYDSSFSPSNTGVSRFVGLMGAYSYSIYLLHFFVVFKASKFVHERVMDISNFYVACLWAGAFFIFMMLPAYLSFRFIESPFLKLRKRYVRSRREDAHAAPLQA